ncbi:AAA family ATPase [Pseudomonas quasicaspiana]|uniref:AAA family ATPase n=1 Tax=Pseudomonas quasicaspiana TaxID=2829821 RepID=UPI001E3DBFCD|nr:AAA family ATPase [Pseudomonas quasicaspiana]MCD5979227.1 AAA family ATPase [Pseudomonas quasicaspiana]MCD5991223.1 AAA family ATPase [Pseudomonas quasicaspiana]
MKILAIRLKNLASLAGPFELDFTAEPLASAGLFAITGPTGAGKSTLLDALCLALFGAIPRLSNIGQSRVPEIDGDISTNDPRTLLRRGTGSGYAEVDFVGIDKRRYRARWETNRARDNATKKLQASRQTLTDLDSEQILSTQNKSEYKTMLEARLGLNFEQFTRAVMLAQSEFSAFLKADDKERSELLEKLTDTAIYSQLGRRAFSKSKEAEKLYEDLKLMATGIAPMPPEQRAELEQHFSEAQQQLKTQQAQQRQLELKQQWLTELLRLRDEHLSASEQLASAQQDWENQSSQRQLLGQLERLAPQRHLFAQRHRLDAQLNPLSAQIAEHAQRQNDLQARQTGLEEKQLAANSALEQAEQQKKTAAPIIGQAFEQQGNLTHLNKEVQDATLHAEAAERTKTDSQAALNQLLDQQRLLDERLQSIAGQLEKSAVLAPLSKAWTAYRPRLQEAVKLSARLNKGREELPELEKNSTRAEQELTDRRNALQGLYSEAQVKAEAINAEIQRLGQLLHDNRQQHSTIDSLERIWQRHQDIEKRLQDVELQQQQANEQRNKSIASGLQFKTEHEAAEQALKVTVELLQRQRLARSASVEELRAQLIDQQPCPVCGSEDHPYHQSDALLQALSGYDDSEENSARLKVSQLSEKLAELRAEVTELNARLKQARPQLEQLSEQLQKLTPELEAHPLYARLLEQPEQLRNDWLSERLHALTEEIATSEQRQRLLLKVQQDAEQLQQNVQSARDASQHAMKMLDDQQRNIALDNQAFEAALQEFEPLLPAESLSRWREAATDSFMQLDNDIAQRLEQLDRQQEEQQEHAERARRIEREQDSQHNLEQERAKQQQRLADLQAQQLASQQRLAEMLGDHTSAEQWQQQLETAQEQARRAQAAVSDELQQARSELIKLATGLESEQSRLQALQQELAELDQHINEWRSAHPELDDAALEVLLGYSDEGVSQLRQQLQQSEKTLEQSRVLLQERDKQLQQHQAHHSDVTDAEQLTAALLEAQKLCAEHEQQCADLRAQLSEDDRRNNASRELQEQIANAHSEYLRWARLAALIGSAEGDRFRKIAQAYNLDLLVHHANAQLKQLVRRYRLKRGGSMLGLLVMDTEMGDELRSVHSLSGGETFLVSLALALGLASMASSTLKIESLFIDEGFGSLDPESLQLAMDALDGLQAQGRKVGVISHVQEMHERIPVQIQVKRQGNGLSTVEVSN